MLVRCVREPTTHACECMRCDAHTLAQVTRQFGEMDPECAAKQKFAAWRAAEVRSALKEGRPPTPLPPKVEELPLDDRYDLRRAVLERGAFARRFGIGAAFRFAVTCYANRATLNDCFCCLGDRERLSLGFEYRVLIIPAHPSTTAPFRAPSLQRAPLLTSTQLACMHTCHCGAHREPQLGR